MISASAMFMSHTEAITCLPQIVTLRGCEERMHHDASTLAAVVGEKAHLEMK